MSHSPGLAPFDTLRTYTAAGGHITTTWFAAEAPVGEVSVWYEQRLPDHECRQAGDRTRTWVTDGLRHFHGVTVHAPQTPPPGPRPTQPPPPGTRTVVRDSTGAFPAAAATPAPPPARPSLLQRLGAKLR
ncbi:hypothetical protein [Dactylosporangium sp. NPDC005555]|uniref:hypothetical protein n=1 Tax=Dactylosporangium sp. NPDC005555 TaxID=3154889 RepID=UPI0033B25422